MSEHVLNIQPDTGSRKEYLMVQTYKLRLWALIVGSAFTLITILMDYFRFPSQLSQVTMALRFMFLLVPITWLTIKYITKNKNDHNDHMAWLFYITIAAGLLHSYVYYAANMQGIYFPKAGIAIVLIYAGLLFAMPVVLSAFSSTTIIIQAGITYYLKDESISDIMVLMIFYTMISLCCILINYICIRILSKNYKLINIIKNQAYTDALTGLYNRRFFYLESKKRAKQAQRDGLKYAVITIDLDHFKQLNDNFGHKFGDEALVNVSELLRANCNRPFDFATRMGGDEFVLFLYGTDKDYTVKTCQSIITKMAQLELKTSKEVNSHYLSASIGAVIVDDNFQNYQHINEVIEKADNLLYLVKEASKNDFKLKELTA